MEAAVNSNGKADADHPDASHADTLFDASDIFSSDRNGRAVFSNGVSKQRVPKRRSILHIWNIT